MSRTSKKQRASIPGEQRSRPSAKWRQGTVQEFLGLSDEVSELIRVKAVLAVLLRRRRRDRSWSQAVLAERIGSGQSRVAKIEAAHPSVSLDLLIKALLVTGATMPDIASVMATGDPNTKPVMRKSKAKRAKRGRRKVAG